MNNNSEHSDRVNALTKIFYNVFKFSDDYIQPEEIEYNEITVIKLLLSLGFEKNKYLGSVYLKKGLDIFCYLSDTFTLSKFNKKRELIYSISSDNGLNYKEVYEKIKEHFRTRSERINNFY